MFLNVGGYDPTWAKVIFSFYFPINYNLFIQQNILIPSDVPGY